MSLVLQRVYAKEHDIPRDAFMKEGPFRDEHTPDSLGGQTEDLYIFLIARDTVELRPEPPARQGIGPVWDGSPYPEVERGVWLHAKGSLYWTEGWTYHCLIPSSVNQPDERVAYTSLDSTIRPGTRRSLRTVRDFRRRFVYLGPGFPVVWADDLVDRISHLLLPEALQKLQSYNDPGMYLLGLKKALSN